MLKATGAREEQVVVLPNGVDGVWLDRPPLVSKEEGTRFLMVGRNEYRKGFHILEKALLLLNKPIELHFVGDWPKLKTTHHNLTYHGVVREKEQMMEIMDSCDVLLLPSLSEGMPTVVLEAMARGLQVVGTDVGAMSDLQDGLLPPGDAQALAAAIRQFPMTPKQCQLPLRFSWKEIARHTLSALKPVCVADR